MSDEIKPIATNQTNYPILIEVYEVSDECITFQSFNAWNSKKMSARRCTNMVYMTIAGRAYFKHFGTRYFLDECMTIF